MSDMTMNATPHGFPVGQIETVDGPVFVIHAGGTRAILQKGDSIYQGDQLETGEQGAVSVTFADHSTFSLGAKGAMAVDEFLYDPAGGMGSSLVTVTEGIFVFVSGQIAKTSPDAMMVRTPVMSIGVRGTKVAGQASKEGRENNVTLLREDDGQVGEIVLFNGAGTRVLNQAFQSVAVDSLFQLPPSPVVLSAAEIKALYGTALDVSSRSERAVDPAQKVAPVAPDLEDSPAPTPEKAPPQGEDGERPHFHLLRKVLLMDHDLLDRGTADPLEPLLRPIDYKFEPRLIAPTEERDTDPSTSTASAPEATEIIGTDSADSLVGTPAPDIIKGYGGNDMLHGSGADDQMYGGDGNDALYGAEGADRLYGENGTDRLLGDAGNDRLSGGLGGDTIYGGVGRDVLAGGGGADLLSGGTGADVFLFERPSDCVYVAVNGRVPAAQSYDHILDFAHGEDTLEILAAAFGFDTSRLADGVNFEVISDTYNGTNALSTAFAAGKATLILDGDGNLCFDDNGSADGYTVVAQIDNAQDVTAADITLA